MFEPRSASSCRRVFQDDFAKAFASADEVLIAPVFRSTLPGGGAAVGAGARSRPERGGPARPRGRLHRRHRRGNRPGAPRRRSRSCSCPTAGSAASTTNFFRRSGECPPALRLAGDSALVVEFEETLDAGVNASRRSLWLTIVRAARLAGVRDVVPAFHSLTVYFDPLRRGRDAAVRDGFGRAPRRPSSRQPTATMSGSFAFRSAIRRRGRSRPAGRGGIRGHARRRSGRPFTARGTYRVFMLGFVPGFAYLAPVDDRIAMPRLDTPRDESTRGFGRHRGPADGDLSWRDAGRLAPHRTDGFRPFDLSRGEPFLFKAGDRVQFHAEVCR